MPIALAWTRPLLERPRRTLAILTLAIVAAVLVLTLGSSSGDADDPAQSSLVDAAGLTPRQAGCILGGASAEGVDVGALRELIVDPSADSVLSAADQRRVNEIAEDCLAG